MSNDRSEYEGVDNVKLDKALQEAKVVEDQFVNAIAIGMKANKEDLAKKLNQYEYKSKPPEQALQKATDAGNVDQKFVGFEEKRRQLVNQRDSLQEELEKINPPPAFSFVNKEAEKKKTKSGGLDKTTASLDTGIINALKMQREMKAGQKKDKKNAIVKSNEEISKLIELTNTCRQDLYAALKERPMMVTVSRDVAQAKEAERRHAEIQQSQDHEKEQPLLNPQGREVKLTIGVKKQQAEPSKSEPNKSEPRQEWPPKPR